MEVKQGSVSKYSMYDNTAWPGLLSLTFWFFATMQRSISFIGPIAELSVH